jgi:plastocyanin
MRKLEAATAAIAATAFALIAATAGHGALLNITVLDDEYDPKVATFNLIDGGDSVVRWGWGPLNSGTSDEHTVTQKKGLFNSGAPKDDGQFDAHVSAGTFGYFCEVHGNAMKGKIKIVPGASDVETNQFRVFWANPTSKTGNRYTLRYRVNGGDWEPWLTNTRKREKVFGANEKPVPVNVSVDTYEIAARSQKGKPNKHKQSGWSPPVTVPTG